MIYTPASKEEPAAAPGPAVGAQEASDEEEDKRQMDIVRENALETGVCTHAQAREQERERERVREKDAPIKYTMYPSHVSPPTRPLNHAPRPRLVMI